MTLSDISIMGKKILVGVIVFLVPLLVIGGSLYLITVLLKR
jgi:hypothetical protein